MDSDFRRVEDALEDYRLSLIENLDQIIDFCVDPFGIERELDQSDVKDLIKMLKELQN